MILAVMYRGYGFEMGYTDRTNLLQDLGLRGNPVKAFEQSLINSSSKNVAIDGLVILAMIIRSKIYTSLLDEMKLLGKKLNFMTVSAAIRELEKIELTRQTDNIYRLDHAVTAT